MGQYSASGGSIYVDGGYSWTIATLPAANLSPFKYARVTDLHDGQPDVCISDGTFWKPVRPLATRSIADSNVAMTLTALVNSPTQIMMGNLTANRDVALSTQYAYPGARFRIKREATGGLVNLRILSGVAGPLLNLLGVTSWADYEFNGTTWIQTASGGLL